MKDVLGEYTEGKCIHAEGMECSSSDVVLKLQKQRTPPAFEAPCESRWLASIGLTEVEQERQIRTSWSVSVAGLTLRFQTNPCHGGGFHNGGLSFLAAIAVVSALFTEAELHGPEV